MVLNEPETSLHADLIEPLARLILRAQKSTQLIVISHNQAMLETLSQSNHVKHFALRKDFGETVAVADEDNARWV